MGEHVYETSLFVPKPREEIFPFFADAGNLDRITPPWLHFRILTPLPIEMRAGARIEYRIRLRGVSMRWRTLISAWEPPVMFVDEQVQGPYRTWHHTHTFEPVEGGTLCRDRVVYAAPGGGLVHRYFVRPEIEKIFAYRRDTLLKIFAGRPAVAGA